MMRAHHGHLIRAGVTVGVLTAHAPTDDEGNPKGAALKLHGVRCAATIKVTTQEQRVKGFEDAIIKVDGDRWDTFSPERQEAIIDHELTHLNPTGDTDDCGRPKIKTRSHDVDLGGFTAIVERHGRNAVEAEILDYANHLWQQKLLPFGETA